MADFSWDPEEPLVRAKGELRTANEALHTFHDMQPATMVELHQHYVDRAAAGDDSVPTTVLATIRRWSSRYDWRQRLDRQYDMEAQRQRQQWREVRREVLAEYREKVRRRLEEFDPTSKEHGWSGSELTTAIKALLDQTRAEFDDLPTEKHEHTADVTFTADDYAQAEKRGEEWRRDIEDQGN